MGTGQFSNNKFPTSAKIGRFGRAGFVKKWGVGISVRANIHSESEKEEDRKVVLHDVVYYIYILFYIYIYI